MLHFRIIGALPRWARYSFWTYQVCSCWRKRTGNYSSRQIFHVDCLNQDIDLRANAVVYLLKCVSCLNKNRCRMLTLSIRVYYETLRMFPPVRKIGYIYDQSHKANWCTLSKVTGIPKMAAEDTSITAGNANGSSAVIPVPKGTDITLNVPGLHYNRSFLIFFATMGSNDKLNLLLTLSL